MAISNYRGINLKAGGPEGRIWKVKIKNHVLQGSLSAVKKSIDWWCDTAAIIDPQEFSKLEQQSKNNCSAKSESFSGYILRNDTGEQNDWYCLFNGKLIKGGKSAIQRHIQAFLIAKEKALQSQQQKK